jgi:aquaporin Z
MIRRLIGESVGTFTLVTVGPGAIALNEVTGGMVTHTGICLTFGIVVALMILIFGKISGAHINPAVTIALWIERKFHGRYVLPYIVAQCIGALAAGFVLALLFPASTTLGATLPTVSTQSAFTIEVIISALLFGAVYFITSKTHHVKVIAPFIGSVVFLLAYISGPATGASMNPARSIGPAVASGDLQYLWLYITAPIIGMFIPGLVVSKHGLRTSRNDVQ